MSASASRAGSPPIRVYRPDSRDRDGPVTALVHLASELWQHRAHIAVIFERDFRAACRGTRLGLFWSFTLPLLPISAYILLSVVGVFPAIEGMPHSVFVCLSMTVWLLFSGLVEQPITVVRARNGDAMRTSLPLAVAIAASFANLAFETLLRAGLVIVLMAATLTTPVATAPLALLVLLVGAAFSLSVGLVCALASMVVPDVRGVVLVVMRYGMFLSGVIFPLAAIPPLAWLEWINPFAILLEAMRDLMFVGHLQYPLPLAVLAAFTAAVSLFSARLFHLMELRLRGAV